jgi:hypothetical protein
MVEEKKKEAELKGKSPAKTESNYAIEESPEAHNRVNQDANV